MTRCTRLDRLEADLEATVQRLTGAVVATLTKELTIAERRAFCRVAERVLALRARGEPCPTSPANRDVIADGATVRLPGGAVLATTEEWAPYRRVAIRVAELWKHLNGPEIGFETAADEPSPARHHERDDPHPA